MCVHIILTIITNYLSRYAYNNTIVWNIFNDNRISTYHNIISQFYWSNDFGTG